jgi:hypothetical protein
MIFPLLKIWLGPFIPSTLRSSSNNKTYKARGNGFVTIGGGGASSRNRQGSQGVRSSTIKMTLDNESEEHIVKGNDNIRMQNMRTADGRQPLANAIVVSKQISITTADCSSERSAESFKQV